MPFDWTEYLVLARFLLGQAGNGCDQEAGCRTVVSRAYYAAYNHARLYATAYLGFVPRTRLEERSQDHGRLRDHLRRRRRSQVAVYLEELRGWRNECDYQDDIPPGVDITRRAVQAVASAAYVISGLKPPAPGPAAPPHGGPP